MNGVQFYRDKDLPLEIKLSYTISDLSYKKHSHEEYSLGVVNKGESLFWCEGKLTEIYQKTLVFIPHNIVHACNPHSDKPWEYKMIYVQPYWVDGFMESKGGGKIRYPIVKDISKQKVFSELNNLIENLISSVSFLEKEASLLSIFEQLAQDVEQGEPINKKELQPKLKVIKDYLHSFFLEKITLEQLEQVSGLNKFHIIRAFKEEFSIPPHTYQTLLRINYAKKELQKYRPITEVAYETGFYDQSHFNKAFKNHVGVTPDRYQKLI
jgi:AraC-like DNA-binding protein